MAIASLWGMSSGRQMGTGSERGETFRYIPSTSWLVAPDEALLPGAVRRLIGAANVPYRLFERAHPDLMNPGRTQIRLDIRDYPSYRKPVAPPATVPRRNSAASKLSSLCGPIVISSVLILRAWASFAAAWVGSCHPTLSAEVIFKFRRQGRGFLVYSIGQNLKARRWHSQAITANTGSELPDDIAWNMDR